MKHIVLSAKPYEFKSKDGDTVKGVTVSYLNSKPSSRPNEFGFSPLIISSSSLDGFSKKDFEQIPGVFDMEFEQVTGKDHKPALILTNMSFVEAIDLTCFL